MDHAHAGIHNHPKPACPCASRGLVVCAARLQPQGSRAYGPCLIGKGRRVLRRPEHDDDIDLIRDVRELGVCFLPENLCLMRVPRTRW
jgi:hypothetical protein